VGSEIHACPACGVVNDRANTVIAELRETVTQLGIEVASKRKAIKALRSDQSGEHPPEYDEAMEVAEYWRDRCSPRARELNGTRLRNTVARLRAGYDVDTLKQAIDGYAARPNVKDGKRVREGGRRFCDLELIMRDEKHVQSGVEIAIEEMRSDQGVLAGAGSRWVAEMCGCGHPRISHQLARLVGHDACAERDCTCGGFDDLPVAAEQWLHREGHYDRKRSGQIRSQVQATDQARLL
jgi:hypothetical protein